MSTTMSPTMSTTTWAKQWTDKRDEKERLEIEKERLKIEKIRAQEKKDQDLARKLAGPLIGESKQKIKQAIEHDVLNGAEEGNFGLQDLLGKKKVSVPLCRAGQDLWNNTHKKEFEQNGIKTSISCGQSFFWILEWDLVKKKKRERVGGMFSTL